MEDAVQDPSAQGRMGMPMTLLKLLSTSVDASQKYQTWQFLEVEVDHLNGLAQKVIQFTMYHMLV
jgi:hypothetical protein